jgi:hypothetical protein
MNIKAKLLYSYRITRRKILKFLGGYVAEARLYSTFPFKHKTDPEIKFFIFTYQRTGSSLLVDLLNSHPQITCDGEILLNKMIAPDKYLYYHSRLCTSKAYGFKLQISHLNYQHLTTPKKFVDQLYNDGYQIIKLTRQNLFNAALSLQYAISSQKFHFKRSPKKPKLPKISIEPKKFLDTFQWVIYQKELLDQICNDLPHLDIVYENDLAEINMQQSTINRILDFLGLPHAYVESDYVKGSKQGISQFINNLEEIKEYSLKNGYGKYIH